MLYRIALAVFLITFGLVLLFVLGRTAEIIAGIASIIAGTLVALEANNGSRVN